MSHRFESAAASIDPALATSVGLVYADVQRALAEDVGSGDVTAQMLSPDEWAQALG